MQAGRRARVEEARLLIHVVVLADLLTELDTTSRDQVARDATSGHWTPGQGPLGKRDDIRCTL